MHLYREFLVNQLLLLARVTNELAQEHNDAINYAIKEYAGKNDLTARIINKHLWKSIC